MSKDPNKWPGWVSESTNPNGNEVQRITASIEPELVDAAAQATEPLDREINRLLRSRAHAQMPVPAAYGWFGFEPRQIGMVGAGAAALLAVGAYTAMPASYGPIGSPVGEVAEWHGSFELGPSIDVTADGSLMVAQADRRGTVVDLIDGTAEFSVTPGGEYRHLLVHAQDVEVEVIGTVFDVSIDNGVVWVGCERGKVEVRYAGLEFYVEGGEAWNTAELAVALEEAKPAAPRTNGLGATDAAHDAVASVPARVRAPVGAPPAMDSEDVVEVEVEGSSEWSRPKTAAGDLVKYTRIANRGASLEEKIGMWDQFLADWPDAYEADEARLFRMEARLFMQPTRSGLGELDALIDATSDRPDLLERAHELKVQIGVSFLNDCGLALDSFRWQAGHDQLTPLERAEASAYLGLCSATEQGEAKQALRRAQALGLKNPMLVADVDIKLAALEGTRER